MPQLKEQKFMEIDIDQPLTADVVEDGFIIISFRGHPQHVIHCLDNFLTGRDRQTAVLEVEISQVKTE